MAGTKTENNSVVSALSNKYIADFDPPQKPKRNKFAFACAILASMTSILLGYGCSSGGLAALFYCDGFRKYFPQDATIKCLADAGKRLNNIVGSVHGVAPITMKTIKSFPFR